MFKYRERHTTVTDTITLGESVVIKGVGADGTAPYTYSYYYKKSSVSNWNTKLENTKTASTSFKPGAAVPYDVKVVVKDANGNTEEKTFTVKVNPGPLENVSTVTKSIKLGESIKITGKASGGTAPYTYSYYYKKSSVNNWNTKLANTKSTSTSFKPGSAVPYDVKVVITDASGKSVEKVFTVNVSK